MCRMKNIGPYNQKLVRNWKIFTYILLCSTAMLHIRCKFQDDYFRNTIIDFDKIAFFAQFFQLVFVGSRLKTIEEIER